MKQLAKDFQNIQTAHAAQYQKNNQPNKKWPIFSISFDNCIVPANITEFLILVLKIEVKFTYHKIKRFEVCNPVVSSIFRSCAIKFTIKFQEKPLFHE